MAQLSSTTCVHVIKRITELPETTVLTKQQNPNKHSHGGVEFLLWAIKTRSVFKCCLLGGQVLTVVLRALGSYNFLYFNHRS